MMCWWRGVGLMGLTLQLSHELGAGTVVLPTSSSSNVSSSNVTEYSEPCTKFPTIKPCCAASTAPNKAAGAKV